MLPVVRVNLPETILQKVTKRTPACTSPESARVQWNAARTEKKVIRSALEQMASTLLRCMYCSDSRGTAIDHFEPIAVAPRRTFDWSNHLFACSFCNSNEKRDQWPLDANNHSLLIDPSVDDPWLHIRLAPSGKYVSTTEKGEKSIAVFGLNRRELVLGRQAAWFKMAEMLGSYAAEVSKKDVSAALRQQMFVCTSPFSDVLYAFLNYAAEPRLAAVLPADAATYLHSYMLGWVVAR